MNEHRRFLVFFKESSVTPVKGLKRKNATTTETKPKGKAAGSSAKKAKVK